MPRPQPSQTLRMPPARPAEFTYHPYDPASLASPPPSVRVPRAPRRVPIQSQGLPSFTPPAEFPSTARLSRPPSPLSHDVLIGIPNLPPHPRAWFCSDCSLTHARGECEGVFGLRNEPFALTSFLIKWVKCATGIGTGRSVGEAVIDVQSVAPREVWTRV